MIPLLDFTDLPRTPAALAGTIVGNQLRFWRGAMTLMGSVPAAQLALAREAMAATYGVTGKTGTKTAVPSSANDTVAKPAPARRKATRKPARPAQSAAVKTSEKPAPDQVTTPKDANVVATSTGATSGQSGFASQRTTSGGSAAKSAASTPSAPGARRKTPRAPSKPAQMPAPLKSAAARSEAKPVAPDSRQVSVKQTGTTSAQALMTGQAAGAAPGQQVSGKLAAAKPATAKPAAAKAKPASKSRAKQ
ncbi:hypothetical protein [Phaeobacter piscinae]|uniref:hypothetical protein n=1 Tax=Phaeobacter piscinae TaxID=1580596 RepID=UPI00210AF870|nr:hypothetical protein [Phaeobacter piscinae]UTS81190.1 hypothetical protein OL67_002268 [Phaeobacter piscinae]